MLICTRKAAELTGLSEYELRYGFKQGIYPALEVGRGSRRLQQAIRDAMCARRAAADDDFTFTR